MTSVKYLKDSLRKEIKAKLLNISKEAKLEKTNIIIEKLYSLPEFCLAKKISVFLSMEDEVETKDILTVIFGSNKECYIPRYDIKSNYMDMVKLDSLLEYKNLPETKWKIKQPPLDSAHKTAMQNGGLDAIIVPGLAFTQSGKRLGRGRGYYDTYLHKCLKSGHEPFKIGLAFTEQIVEDLPTEDTDVLVDIVLSA